MSPLLVALLFGCFFFSTCAIECIDYARSHFTRSMSIPAGYKRTITFDVPSTCTMVRVHGLGMSSTDGSDFTLLVQPSATSTTFYPALSTSETQATKCFYMGDTDKLVVPTVAIVVECWNSAYACSLIYEWTLSCQEYSTPTSAPTSAPTTATITARPTTKAPIIATTAPTTKAPTNPVILTAAPTTKTPTTKAPTNPSIVTISPATATQTPTTVPPTSDPSNSTSTSGCRCICCIGNLCDASYVGVVYGTSSSCSSDTCDRGRCASFFPTSCPASGVSGISSAACSSTITNINSNGSGTGTFPESSTTTSSSSNTPIIIAVCASIGGIIILALIGIFIYYYLRRYNAKLATQQSTGLLPPIQTVPIQVGTYHKQHDRASVSVHPNPPPPYMDKVVP